MATDTDVLNNMECIRLARARVSRDGWPGWADAAMAVLVDGGAVDFAGHADATEPDMLRAADMALSCGLIPIERTPTVVAFAGGGRLRRSRGVRGRAGVLVVESVRPESWFVARNNLD